MIYVFLANGFEEIEALAPVDFLLRAGIDVKTVGVSGKFCRGAHGINVEADILLSDAVLDSSLDGIILPGGMPGAENLNNSGKVQEAIDYCVQNNKIIGEYCVEKSTRQISTRESFMMIASLKNAIRTAILIVCMSAKYLKLSKNSKTRITFRDTRLLFISSQLP